MRSNNIHNLSNGFYVGDWYIEPETLCIQRNGQERKLEPKVMEVLVHLAQHPGQVLSRQDIEASVWQDMVVGYDSLGSTIIKLRKAFNDDPKNPTVIQTIPKKGYRLIAPIQFDESQKKTPAIGKERVKTQLPQQGFKSIALLSTSAILLVMLIAYWIYTPKTHDPNIKPTLAVLPFKNISDDPQQEYFSDGLTSDLITDLANIANISVISRSSVFNYKNTDIDLRLLKNELNVDYIIEGSVRKDNNKVRVSARLVNVDTGVSLWANRYDAELKDVFSLQDDVVQNILSSLELKLSKKEKTRIARSYTNSIEAYDTFLHGWQYFWHYTKESNQLARHYYQKAIDLDKAFARAHANLGVTHAFDFMNGWSQSPDFSLKQAKIHVNKALEIDKELPQVQWAAGIVHTYSREYTKAISAAEKAIEHSPNFADGYGLLATILNFAGRPDEAKPLMEKAMRLNPHHPFIYKMIQGQIHFNLYEYTKAAQYFEIALQRNPTAQEVNLWLAASYAYLDNLDDAKWQLEQILAEGTELSIEYVDRFIPLEDQTMRQHLLDGLIKAGLRNLTEQQQSQK